VQLVRLTLNNFRSWQNTIFEPVKGLNILRGGNAQGKSNLLEAIFFLATGKSFRTYRDRELAYMGEDSFAVGGLINSPTGEFSVVVRWEKQNGKSFTLNREQQGRLADLLGLVTAVVFAPEDLLFIKGGPQLRRQALNLLLLQTSRQYYFHLREYNRVLAQRNMFLKRFSPSSGNEALLSAWDEQLVTAGAELMIRRQQVLAIMSPWVKEYNYRLGSVKELSLHYEPNIALDPETNLNEAKAAFLQQLIQSRREEWRRRLTLSGPQRDELLFKLKGQELKSFGSQGEQRTAALAWKLAEAKYIRQRTGQQPILLLDDVYSELDDKRRRFLTGEVSVGSQAFITTTESKDSLLTGAAAYFEIDSGTIKRV
jgi:DNA replication and repair protein RecF